MTPEQKIELAGNVITYGKAVAPDRFPVPTEQVVAVWADVLGSMSFPPGVWPEAVRVWAGELAGERMCTPADLKRAAKVVVSRWESVPERRAVLEAHRERRRVERDRLLAEGRFGAVRGWSARAVESRPVVSDGVLERARGVVGV